MSLIELALMGSFYSHLTRPGTAPVTRARAIVGVVALVLLALALIINLIILSVSMWDAIDRSRVLIAMLVFWTISVVGLFFVWRGMRFMVSQWSGMTAAGGDK